MLDLWAFRGFDRQRHEAKMTAKIAPMSLYKIMEGIKSIRRFQPIQTGVKRLELRLVSDQKESGFADTR